MASQSSHGPATATTAMASFPPPTFLTLPPEIRLQIYSYLLLPQVRTPQTLTLHIRTMSPDRYPRAGSFKRRRYYVMGGRLRSSTLPTTYHLLPGAPTTTTTITTTDTTTTTTATAAAATSPNAQPSPPPPLLHPSILLACRQTHAEASPLLYSSYTFDFDRDVEAVKPFLSDLTPATRRCVRRLAMVKRALPYTKDFDACEWREVCAYLAAECEIEELGLRVSGGKVPGSGGGGAGGGGAVTHLPGFGALGNSVVVAAPGPPAGEEGEEEEMDLDLDGEGGGEGEEEKGVGKGFQKSDFGLISRIEGMEWVRQLLAIKNLKSLDVSPIWEVCPPPCSNALSFFVSFSESIENGFAEFLRENMVAGAA